MLKRLSLKTKIKNSDSLKKIALLMDITSEKLFTKGDIAMLSTAQFDTLAAKYMDTIYRFAFSWLKSHADADDVTQNVLLALYRAEYVFESEEHVRNWLMKVTANECRKLWRRPFRSHENIDDYAEKLVFKQPSYQELFEAVMGLDKAKRLVVVLYYAEGYSIKEISEILEIPEGTVGTRLARARAQLKQYLKEEESNE